MDKMKSVPKTDYDVMTVECAKKMALNSNIRELAAHIADISSILDRMNYNAGTGWEDQAIIALMAGTRMAVWQANGMPPLAPPLETAPAANDNDEDMKMAA